MRNGELLTGEIELQNLRSASLNRRVYSDYIFIGLTDLYSESSMVSSSIETQRQAFRWTDGSMRTETTNRGNSTL